MYTLKGAIFSLRDTLVVEGSIDPTLMGETVKLLKFLLARNVTPVIVSNSSWIETASKREIPDILSEMVGYKIPYFRGGHDMPMKQFAGAMEHVLQTQNWQPEEAIYIGSTKEDMIAAKNGKLMFLNARWHAQNSAYGFEFESPKDIARFVDCCCLSIGDWFWAIENGDLKVYCIAPLAEYSKSYPTAGAYSTDAKQAVKFNKGDVRFWGRMMGARLYFPGWGESSTTWHPIRAIIPIRPKRFFQMPLRLWPTPYARAIWSILWNGMLQRKSLRRPASKA